jgi:hypothetical protein
MQDNMSILISPARNHQKYIFKIFSNSLSFPIFFQNVQFIMCNEQVVQKFLFCGEN